MPETLIQPEHVMVLAIEALKRTSAEIKFRNQYFSITFTGLIGLHELKIIISDEIKRFHMQEIRTLKDFPSIDRMRLRFKDFDGIICHLTCDEGLEDLMDDQSVLELIVFEDDPVSVKFTYCDCVYEFQVFNLNSIDELRIHIYDTIIEDYRKIGAKTGDLANDHAMRMFVKDINGRWIVLVHDYDLEVAIKATNSNIEVKFDIII